MATLDEYIASLDNLGLNIDDLVRRTVMANEGNLLGTIKLRLFQRGVDANGASLGPYSPYTVKLKKGKGQRASFVTLRDSGDWYNSMFIEYRERSIIVDSSDPKTDILTDIYGEAILGLSQDELENFIDSKLDIEITKAIEELPDFKMDPL